MLKFGTGQITVRDDTRDPAEAPLRTAAALTDEERAAVLAEDGEDAETSEGE